MYLTNLFLIVASLTIPGNDSYYDYSNFYRTSERLLNNDTIEININIETWLYAESNDFKEFIVAEETTIYSDDKTFQVTAPNIKDYNYIEYYFYVTNAIIEYNNDFITGSYELAVDIGIYNTNTGDNATANQYYTINYQYEYYGGAWGGLSTTDMDTTTSLNVGGELYLSTETPDYTKGYNKGFEDGQTNEKQQHPLFKIFNAVFNVIDNVLSVEILPSIKLWYILGVPLFFLILQFVLNLFR